MRMLSRGIVRLHINDEQRRSAVTAATNSSLSSVIAYMAATRDFLVINDVETKP